MRQFILGILATVVGGTILFLITNWYTGWANTENYRVEYRSEPASAFIGNLEIKAVGDMLNKEGFNSGKIGIIKIENLSGDDIRNAEFVISPTESNFSEANLHGFGLASHIAGEMPNPKLSLAGDGIHVNFPVLESKNGSFIWILHEPPQGFRVFSDQKPIDLSEYAKWDEESGLDFAFVFFISALCFFLGIFGGNAISQSVLRKAGYDPKTISAKYYRKLADDEEAKAKGNSDA